ncbi:MAG: hypothetical protein K8M05_39000 [Deltaproteobacteria bacterium]|nr:hypothetical protein [Kofleriaceae bacterium]
MPSLGVGPPALDEFFRRALAKKAEDRFEHALALAAGLRAASGVADTAADLPRLDADLRDGWLAEAPQFLAETVAALDGARNAHQARDAAWEVASGLVRYLVAIAMASRAQVREDRIEPQLLELLRAATRRDLGDDERVRLIRAIVRPFAARRGAFPIPALVDLVTPSGSGDDALEGVLALRTSGDAGGRVSDEHVRSHLARLLPAVARLLRAASFVLDHALVVTRDGEVERWVGLRRPRRALAVVRDRHPPERRPALLGRDGSVALELWPLVQVIAPAAGAAEELFVFDGHGRHGARLVAAPMGFEHRDAAVWEWLGEHVLGEAAAAPASDEQRAPYLGLAPFGAADADRFFGREREIDAFINRMRQMPLQIVVGASGAGKSSFVHAGVIPALPGGWRTVSMRPGSAPLATLRAKLADEGLEPELSPTAFARQLLVRMRERRLVLVVDQLEEVFTLCGDEASRVEFARVLGELTISDESPIRVVCTVRDDFLMRFESLAPLRSRLSSSLFLLGNPAREDLVRCVVEPARRVGYAFSDHDLPGVMVDAVAERPGALALLSFTASRLWELRDRRVQQLTRKAYDAMGGVGGALGGHAEATLAGMGAEEQGLVREAFRRLVTADRTRATLGVEELRQILDSPRASAVIDKLVAARLLVVAEDESGGHVEITHEALIAAWPRLQEWIRQDAAGARMRDQLRAASRQWQERHRSDGLLWRDDALAELERWRRQFGEQGLTELERTFADASRAAARRSRRVRRGLALGAFSVMTIAVLVLVAFSREARSQRNLARDNAARAQRLADETRHRAAEQSAEQGRVALQQGQHDTALLHFLAAIDQGLRRTPALDFMLAEAVSPLASQRLVMRGHGDSVTALTRIDDKRFISAGQDGTARIWEVATGRQLALVRTPSPILDMTVDRGGERTLTTGSDGWKRLYTLDGQLLRAWPPSDEPLPSIPAFDPEGRRIVTLSTRSATVWDVETGARRLDFAVGGGPAPFIPDRALWSPSGDAIVAVGYQSAEVHDAETGALRFHAGGFREAVGSVAFSLDGRLLALGAFDRSIHVWNARTGRVAHALQGHSDAVEIVRFDPSGRYLVSASRDRTVRVWDLTTGRLHTELHANDATVTSLSFDTAGTRMVTGAEDGSIFVSEFPHGRPLGRFVGHAGAITELVLRDGALVSASADGTVRSWSLDGVAAASFDAPCDDPYFLELDVARERMAVGCVEGQVQLRSFDGRVLHDLPPHPDELTALGVTVDGGVFSASPALTRIWRPERELRVSADPGDELVAARLSSDGRWLATSSARGLLSVIDASSGTRVAEWTETQPALALSFSAAGAHLVASRANGLGVYDIGGATKLATIAVENVTAGDAAASGDIAIAQGSQLELWSAAGQRRWSVEGAHTGGVAVLAFSPDGTMLASGGRDGSIRLWEAVAGRSELTCAGHEGRLVALALTRDGYVVSAGVDRTVRIWDASTCQQLRWYRDVHQSTVFALRIAEATGQIVTTGADGRIVVRTVPWRADELSRARSLAACIPFRLEGGRLNRVTVPGGCETDVVTEDPSTAR